MRVAAKSFVCPGLLLGFLLASAGAFAVPATRPLHREKKTPEAVVESLPPHYNPLPAFAPYSGAHPSQLQRPAELFPFPIPLGGTGPTEALFAGENIYPFACDTEKSGLGAPEPDNNSGIGTPVYRQADKGKSNAPRVVLGYSRDCSAKTRAQYWYKKLNGQNGSAWAPWTGSETDVEMLPREAGAVPFIVRIEMGTINRFVYALAVLRAADETLEKPGPQNWNHKLIYQFGGGVGIGHRQGYFTAQKILKERGAQLALGYAVVASSGNITSNHYDILLQEDTALRVKRQFTALYGRPLYTVGIGGSGGALQQYLLAQNRPGLLDAGLAQYSYPDMVTQTISVFDCELLEYYFDVTAQDDPLWRDAENRIRIEGYSADNEADDELALIRKLASLVSFSWPDLPNGQTECAKSWRGLTPLVLNPRFVPWADRFAPELIDRVHWSHFEELRHLYGSDENNYARIPWSNVGVQYGLLALRKGQISIEQFLDLNARIGSWRPPAEMKQERFGGLVGNGDSRLRKLSVWSEQNIRKGTRAHPAPRFRGDLAAATAAYQSGLVFLGRLNIPVIDLRHYLDPKLDMHHSSASISTRLRLQRVQGDTAAQRIWVTQKPDDPTPLALAVLDEWLLQIRAHPEKSLLENRPESAQDRCFDSAGHLLAEGDTVWDGGWNQRENGSCMQHYPMYSNPRAMAGDTLDGDRFFCALQSVETALANGVYAPVDMRTHVAELQRIFPQGVCDYAQRDRARPAEL